MTHRRGLGRSALHDSGLEAFRTTHAAKVCMERVYPCRSGQKSIYTVWAARLASVNAAARCSFYNRASSAFWTSSVAVASQTFGKCL